MNRSFGAALNLILGSFVGVLSNNASLLNERVYFNSENLISNKIRQEMLDLASKISHSSKTSQFSDLHPILKFRKAAIVIIATNRLLKLKESQTELKSILCDSWRLNSNIS